MLRHVVLNSGAKMPVIGLGTYLMKDKEHQAVFDYALHIGYRLFDTAFSYGNSQLLGEVLQDNIRSGKVKRRDLFITTKVPSVYLSPADVKDCVSESLEMLKLQYVDLLLIHNPWGQKNLGRVGDGNIYPRDKNGDRILCEHDLNETWSAFERLTEEKKVTSIGLSNLTPLLIDRILSKAHIIPANLQLECNAYCQQYRLIKYCSERGISVTAYAPLAHTRQDTGKTDHGQTDDPVLLKDEVILEMAKSYRKTPAQILLRFLLQQNICVVPKSSKLDRLHENLDVFNFELDASDVIAISKLNRNLKLFPFEWAKRHPDYPKDGEQF
ncbi:aldo-keto reductase family 1 member B1-like [Lineus longissimus]|uniref:aldo-keto reductase family 1 member B1-like n=1 Tax=Lineus longissimus TaxID=88925 RepID=UPI00315D1BAB